MLKKFGVMAMVLAMGGMLAFTGTAVAAKGFKHLSFMGGYMEKHPTTVNVFKPFIAAAEKQFNGKLSFDYFSTNSLYPESEAFAAVTDGRVDIGEVRPSVYPGKMNLLGVVALPGMCPNAIVGSMVAEELIQKFQAVRDEFPPNSVHFTSWASAAYQIHSLKPIRNAEELKGKKIIAWDATTLEYVKALGANPIRMSSPDTYLALSKGMADGVLCPLAPLRSYKITEATKHHLILNLGVNTFCLEANKDLWDSMPDDMRAWLKQEGGLKMAEACGKSLEDGAKDDTAWMEKQGHTFYYLNDEERAAILAPLAKFTDLWQKEECGNMDPVLVEEVLKFARERSRYYTEQVRSGAFGDYKI
ncbi:TRAP transporter substrate-binding protein DctP [Mailhella massiliensis]|uniref:TRAP transporter substrate-binding protein DctP n=1 Tax=Mailhella massiliensis TaxID=1903261 RepID=UPI0023F1F5BE|nr:TRAP transporter substrate-binding protein DctP [Mailhella massiliensis]